MTKAELISYVRDLTGIYSTDLVPDTLLSRWLQESYSELNRESDWPWVNTIATGSLAIGATYFALTSSSYGRIKELTFTYPNGSIEQIVSRKGLIQTTDGDDGFFYDYDETNGRVTLSKATTETLTWKIVYLKDVSTIASTGKATLIPEEFEGILAYRAAAKLLQHQADDSKRAEFLLNEYVLMLETLKTEVIVDEDLGPIQIGGDILRVDGRTVGRLNGRFRSV
jgi:hypothetical protein